MQIELQIRRGNRDDLGIFSILLHKDIHVFCDQEGSRHIFLLRNK